MLAPPLDIELLNVIIDRLLVALAVSIFLDQVLELLVEVLAIGDHLIFSLYLFQLVQFIQR